MNPKGQHLFEIYTTLSYVRVASYTSNTLPCLNTKQVAVKVISKDQQPLANEEKFILQRVEHFDVLTVVIVFQVLLSKAIRFSLER